MEELSKEEIRHYSRHLLLEQVGKKGQLKLKNAKVLVIGAGGLGTPIIQYLSAAGIGTLGMIDADRVEVSNLQRQTLYTYNDLGKYKVEAAKAFIEARNPLIKVEAYEDFLSTKNALELFEKYDLIVEGTDNFETRYLCNDASILTNKPWVYGGIYKFSGQVSVFNYQNGPTYRCLYPDPPQKGSVQDCATVGVLGVLPSVIGSLQTAEVLKIILGIGTPLSGKLLMYDVLQSSQQIIGFTKNESIQITALSDYDSFCAVKDSSLDESLEIESEALKLLMDSDQVTLLDVRTDFQRNQFDIGGIHLPFENIFDRFTELQNQTKTLVVYCQRGQKSLEVATFLKQKFPQRQIFSLEGGLNTWEY